jgi:alanine dehydrogenase
MQIEGTLLLSRSDVEELLSLTECIKAVENVFRWQGEGKIPVPGILGLKTARGGLHVKAGFLPGDPGYIVAKLNTNFPENVAAFGLPTIQGVILVFAANNGAILAVLDSMEITIKRTAAATAVAQNISREKIVAPRRSADVAGKRRRTFELSVRSFRWKGFSRWI